MCGFAGFLHASPAAGDVGRTDLERMTETLRHRGPDDGDVWLDAEGRVGLGFRRLAILDLSPAGRQPMTSPSGRYIMVFNGEVYNFETLRGELAPHGVEFRGHSDSEVILAAIDRWGIEPALARMVGMFAIALWDRETRELLLVRDRMGIKPLYVARTTRGIAFASELGALMQAPGFRARLDPAWIGSYLRYLFVPAPGTPLVDTVKLRPGHLLRIRVDQVAAGIPGSQAYWTPPAMASSYPGGESGATGASDADRVDQLDRLLQDAVAMRMVADVPVGALLSGGIDSSVVVSLMQRAATGPVRTFTIGFDRPEHDESDHAREIARHLGTDHTELRVSGEDALGIVPRLPAIFDEPLADPSQIPTFLVSRLAREHVTVALSGDGGDELFGGYNRYLTAYGAWPRLAALPQAPRRAVGAFLRNVPAEGWRRAEGLATLLSGRGRLLDRKAEKVGRLLPAGSHAEMYRILMSTSDRADGLLAGAATPADPIWADLHRAGPDLTLGDMLDTDQRYYLPDDLLQKVDRASMAVSLEVRVPILDHRVVEFSRSLPDHLKIRRREGKWILRQVLDRYVPRELVDRPKTGFSVPIESWLGGPLRDWTEDLLLGESPERDRVFSPGALRSTWEEFRAGQTHNSNLIWAAAMFEAWRREWNITDMEDGA